ncbi:MAG: sugar phosphate isomerase/epimerase [Tannerella sp.]|jgi:sugar phosphate isomerase/epimerase|nr:sugar phosphate isomerase/epimerase [Tannerella sp.]
MQSRRDFIKKASLAIAGGVIAPHIITSCGGPKKKLGLQLYSLRDMVKDDGIKKVLEAVAKMGYTNLEPAGYSDGKFYGLAPTEFKKMVDDLGMKLVSSHLGKNRTDDHSADMAWWDKAADAHNDAGMKYMIMPSTPVQIYGDNATLDNVKLFADYFNEIALVVAGKSMKLGYHNHDHEFNNKIDGKPVFDYMVESTSPLHFCFQLDVFWIKKGGYDPVEYMKKYQDRIKLLHIKDEKTIGAANFVDFKAIFEQANAAGIKDWFVEVESYDTTPKEDVKKSADYLFAADFVK